STTSAGGQANRTLAGSAFTWFSNHESPAGFLARARISTRRLRSRSLAASADGGQVGKREHVQHLQHLGRADLDGKGDDHAVVSDVLLLRHVAHAQVL